jgi:malate/lactate dehydrogenase
MKVGIAGCGFVGSSTAFAITLGGGASEIVLIDLNDSLAGARRKILSTPPPFRLAGPNSRRRLCSTRWSTGGDPDLWCRAAK